MALTTITVGDTPSSPAGCSEALLFCCALAFRYRRLPEITCRADVDVAIRGVLSGHGRQGVLRWRQYAYESEWDIRWVAALRVLREYCPELPGALDLPDDHQLAGLPPIPSAGVTADATAGVLDRG